MTCYNGKSSSHTVLAARDKLLKTHCAGNNSYTVTNKQHSSNYQGLPLNITNDVIRRDVCYVMVPVLRIIIKYSSLGYSRAIDTDGFGFICRL